MMRCARSLLLGLAVAGQAQGDAALRSDAAASHDLAVGFVEGFLRDSGELKQCIGDAAVDEAHVRQAIADFKKKSLAGMLDAFKELSAAFHGLPDAMKQCKASEHDVAAVVEALRQIGGIKKLVYHVGKDLVVNGKDIFQEIKTAIEDYQSQKFEDSGVQFGTAARKVVVGTLEVSVSAPSAKQVRDVAKGLVEGFFFDGEDLKTCVGDAVKELQDVEQAVGDFEKKTPADVLAGLKLLSGAIKEFPSALTACKAAEADVKAVVSALAQMAKPAQFAYHVGKDLIVNGKDIFQEIAAAVTDYKTDKFEDFGLQVGRALHKLIVGQELRVVASHDLAVGFVEGFLRDSGELKQCIGDTAVDEAHVRQAIADFKKKSLAGMLDAFKELSAAFHGLPDAMKQCKASEHDVVAVVEALRQIGGIKKLVYHVGKDLVVNGKDIFQEIKTATEDYQSQKFEDSGVQFGTAARKIVVGSQVLLV